MNIKIDKEGFLHIERTGSGYIEQICPFDDGPLCGHWCPLFGEPYSVATPRMLALKICHTTFENIQIKDERTGL